MASSDEEGEILRDCVTKYQFVNSRDVPVSFSVLPLHWSGDENVIESGDSSVVFLHGNTHGGLFTVYKEVIGWKLELSYVVPEVYILSKGKTWIKLQKPRKSYEDIIKTVLIVVHCLHFAKRNIEATREKILSHLTKTLSSYDVVEPLERYLSDHMPLIQIAVAKDKDLTKSKYLETFLIEIDNPGRRGILHEENKTTAKLKFIVSDDAMEDDDDFDDEPEVLFDSVCAYCDNGGDVLPCEGQCIRSFHPTIDTGADTCCESLGFANAAQYEALVTFLCKNCQHQRHQCFACGILGSSDKSSAVEVFPCVSATCGHFYHPECVAKLLCPSDETLAKRLQSQIAAGESFTCPIHKCYMCQQGEDKDVHDLQFAVCRRCPKAYHRKCLPRKIAFEASADGTIEQRAWDNLLPKRILMYCMKHKIIPGLDTPRRDHIIFPSIVRKRNQDGSSTKMMSERRSKAFGILLTGDARNMPKVDETRYNTVTYGDASLEKAKSSTMHRKKVSFNDNISISRNSERPSTMIQSKSASRDMQIEQCLTSRPVKKITVVTPPSVDSNMKTRILKLIKDATSSFDPEEFIKEKKRKCTHEVYISQTGLDKTITMGKVEASVKAARAALKKLENGCSVEDAKVDETRYNTVTYGDASLEKGKSSTMYRKKVSFNDNTSISRNSERPSAMIQSKSASRDMQIEQCLTSRPVKKITVVTPPSVDSNMKTRILKLIKDATSSFDPEEFIKEKKRKCTHEVYISQTGLDKTITVGKVEASVKAARAALKKLENGCSVEDAKAVCEPNILNQLIRWKKKLNVFLAPFLHGARYTSFGRHFTKVYKLKEIVDRLHWYIEDGDTIVDFCCGSNDFSCFMKEKLDSMGKRCSFKNYDLITPKNTFNFEKRDWFSISMDALPEGSRLVMGLNPPFGVQASLANKFIDHALKFKPKLIILIVPQETKRLDQKRFPYDLIWEEKKMLSGKSFYLPGSVGIQNQPLDDWNVTPPPLSLWSRYDWTTKHKIIAETKSHVIRKQNKPPKRVVANSLSNIMTVYRDNVPQKPGGCWPLATNVEDTNMASDDDVVDMDLSSPLNSPTNSRSGCIHPSYYGPHPGFGPPPYADTSVPYGSGIGYGYTPVAFPSHPHPGGTSRHGQGSYANYGHTTYPTNSSVRPQGPTFIYGQPDYTS